MAPEPMSEEMKEDIRRMTETLTNQLTIELLTRAGNQAKYNRRELKERKKAREEAMARAENDGDARDYEEDVIRDIEASVADTTGVSEAKAKVATKVKSVVSRVTKVMNRLSMTKKRAGDKTADDKGRPGHGSKQGGDKT
ncbi:hypothetical protein LCI18_002662 [Fusarium solani-melongenae]|uniref:Uncharacterized protein n=1 Tax=Fusarium solani subsp. cucurbitae TaxID=2747967 RepID=A0ACD3YRS4_FUSSC|nr:hypothetical protein LCI18_002662 [Fusarium solani-melongenae]